MSSSYTLSIAMSDETVNTLEKRGFHLYGFKAVVSDRSGFPVVWFKTDTYSQFTEFEWERQFSAYTSLSDLIPGGKVKASASYEISLGQTFNVMSSKGTGEVSNQGIPNRITIQNVTNSEFTCGVSETVNQSGKPLKPSPICAFPLHGNYAECLLPVEKVLLMFASSPYDAGTVVEQSFGPALLVNLTQVPNREVAYDINKGWEWGDGTWATPYKAGSDLVAALVTVDKKLSLPQAITTNDAGFAPHSLRLEKAPTSEHRVSVSNGSV